MGKICGRELDSKFISVEIFNEKCSFNQRGFSSSVLVFCSGIYFSFMLHNGTVNASTSVSWWRVALNEHHRIHYSMPERSCLLRRRTWKYVFWSMQSIVTNTQNTAHNTIVGKTHCFALCVYVCRTHPPTQTNTWILCSVAAAVDAVATHITISVLWKHVSNELQRIFRRIIIFTPCMFTYIFVLYSACLFAESRFSFAWMATEWMVQLFEIKTSNTPARYAIRGFTQRF